MSTVRWTERATHRPSGMNLAEEHRLERVAAHAVTFLLALRLSLQPGLPLGYAVALAALPVTLGVASRYAGARLLLVLATTAVASGLLLTWMVSPTGIDSLSQTVTQGLRILMIGVGALALLWARSIIGSRALVFTYAVGSFAALGIVGVNSANLWKFSFAVPTTLLLLSLPFVYRKAWVETGVLLGLGLMSAVQDSRSAAATMLIASALLVTAPRGESSRGNTYAVLVRLGLLGLGGFLLVQAALLNGDLGEASRERTMAQMETSGSVLLGGRPELGATWALLRDQPWGYGIGSAPTSTQIEVAKSGMASLGYDPNNGYVENYMFGAGFEVHSVIGDLWLQAGLPGMALALVTLGLVIWGMARQVSLRLASGVMIFLSVRFMWDFAFAPHGSALLTLMLCVALALPDRTSLPPQDPAPDPA